MTASDDGRLLLDPGALERAGGGPVPQGGHGERGWESVASYHAKSRGFAGIGYHVAVRNGEIAYQAASCHRRVQGGRPLSALRDAITALEELPAAAEPAKGHSAVRTALDLRRAQSTYDVTSRPRARRPCSGPGGWTTALARNRPADRGRKCR